MKTLDLSAVTPSVGIIPQKDTVEHITSSYLEGVASLAKSLIQPSLLTGKLVILHGCVATGTNPGVRTLTAGAVFYNGEVYQVPSASFTTTGSQIGIWTLQDVNTGTESKLTDGSDVHVLVDYKFVFAAGLSGSGTFDETSSNVSKKIKKTVIEIGTWDMDSTASKGVSHGLSAVDIRNVSVLILDDTFISSQMLINSESLTGTSGVASTLVKVTGTEIVMSRATDGEFDSNLYDSTSQNRGYITIEHV